MTEREKPLGLDMPFGEALERFIGVDPGELPDNVKLRQKKDRRSDPQELIIRPDRSLNLEC
jgi:hypothetical protein